MPLDPDILAILACPKSKEPLRLTPNEDGLVCEASGLVYPIQDGIPILLVDKAVPIADWPDALHADEAD